MEFSALDLILSGLAAALFFAANLMLVAMSYAVASLRFENFDDDGKKSLSAREQKFVENSQKVGSFATLGAKFFLSAEFIAVYYFFYALLCILNKAPDFKGSFELALAVVLALLFFNYVFCDLPVAAFATKKPIKTLKACSKPFFVFYLATYVFEAAARKVYEKIFSKYSLEDEGSFDHIDVLVKLRAEEDDSPKTLSPYTKKLVRNSIRLNELEISDVMVPRSAVKYLDTENTESENLEIMRKYGHTRYPLCDKSLDNCLGVVHVMDVFRSMETGGVNFRKITRGIFRVKHNDGIIGALSKLRKSELHMAIVEDEFGGIIGLLTLGGILEEIVGRIKADNNDSPDESILRTGKNTYKISGLAPIHNVEDALDIDFENDEVSTFGGLVTQILGRFPEIGESVFLPAQNLKITVSKLSPRRIVECLAEIIEKKDEA